MARTERSGRPSASPNNVHPEAGNLPSGSGLPAGFVLDESDRYTVTEVIYVLTSFRQNHERLKLYRVSLSVIRFLSILNFVYTILGITFLMLALCSDWTPEFGDHQRAQFFRIGLTVSVFAPLASFVDLLALRGLQLWRRSYLLPWLFLYAFIISLIFANALSGVFHQGFRWTYTILLLCVLISFSAWRHVRLQYSEMAKERPACRTVEELAEDLRAAHARANVTSEDPVGDLPPKYEELSAVVAASPPAYKDDNDEVPPPSFAEAAAAAQPAPVFSVAGATKHV